MCECQKENIIVNFINRKLKSQRISLKKYANWAKLINPAYTNKFQLKTTKKAWAWNAQQAYIPQNSSAQCMEVSIETFMPNDTQNAPVPKNQAWNIIRIPSFSVQNHFIEGKVLIVHFWLLWLCFWGLLVEFSKEQPWFLSALPKVTDYGCPMKPFFIEIQKHPFWYSAEYKE